MIKINNRGFTLIELLVVIAVIGILAAVVLASLNNARSKARDTKRIAELKQLQVALELYRNDNGDYPPGTAASDGLWLSRMNTWLVTPGYLAAVPVDPGDGSYRYYADYTSTGTCGGLNYDAYEYAIPFKLENPSSFPSIPGYAPAGSSFNKCVHGALK